MSLAANKQTYDLILGKKWCYGHKAILDCYINTGTFQRKKRNLIRKAIHGKDLWLISVNALTKDVVQGNTLFKVALITSLTDNYDAKPMSEELQEQISKFKNVFSRQTTKGTSTKTRPRLQH